MKRIITAAALLGLVLLLSGCGMRISATRRRSSNFGIPEPLEHIRFTKPTMVYTMLMGRVVPMAIQRNS